MIVVLREIQIETVPDPQLSLHKLISLKIILNDGYYNGLATFMASELRHSGIFGVCFFEKISKIAFFSHVDGRYLLRRG